MLYNCYCYRNWTAELNLDFSWTGAGLDGLDGLRYFVHTRTMGKQKDESGGFTPSSLNNEMLLGSVEWLHLSQTDKTLKTRLSRFLSRLAKLGLVD